MPENQQSHESINKKKAKKTRKQNSETADNHNRGNKAEDIKHNESSEKNEDIPLWEMILLSTILLVILIGILVFAFYIFRLLYQLISGTGSIDLSSFQLHMLVGGVALFFGIIMIAISETVSKSSASSANGMKSGATVLVGFGILTLLKGVLSLFL